MEEGRLLFDEKNDIGIVETITGIHRQLVTVTGRSEHAGTTPMDLRRDAFQGAAQMAVEITRMVEQEGRPAVVTMGKWDVRPGAINVVPGEVRFSIDLRHPEEGTKQRLVEAMRTTFETIAGESARAVSLAITASSLPARMSSRPHPPLITPPQAHYAPSRS